jgi:hypothetical protein
MEQHPQQRQHRFCQQPGFVVEKAWKPLDQYLFDIQHCSGSKELKCNKHNEER